MTGWKEENLIILTKLLLVESCWLANQIMLEITWERILSFLVSSALYLLPLTMQPSPQRIYLKAIRGGRTRKATPTVHISCAPVVNKKRKLRIRSTGLKRAKLDGMKYIETSNVIVARKRAREEDLLASCCLQKIKRARL